MSPEASPYKSPETDCNPSTFARVHIPKQCIDRIGERDPKTLENHVWELPGDLLDDGIRMRVGEVLFLADGSGLMSQHGEIQSIASEAFGYSVLAKIGGSTDTIDFYLVDPSSRKGILEIPTGISGNLAWIPYVARSALSGLLSTLSFNKKRN